MRAPRTVFALFSLVFLLASATPAKAATNVRLTSDSANSTNPRVALDPQGNAVVVWEDARYGNSEILWQKFDQLGDPLSAVVRVTNTLATSANPDVSVDPAGTSHIVWQEGIGGNGEGTVYLCRLDSSGNKILADVTVRDFSATPRVFALPSGASDIVYHRFNVSDQSVYYRRYGSTGAQVCEKNLNLGTLPAIAKTPVVAIDPNSGTAVVYWRDMDTFFNLELVQGQVSNTCGGPSNSVAYANSSAINPSVDATGGVIWMNFERSGDIYNFQGSNNACKISQGSGTSRRPAVGADGSSGYATWQDMRDGNSEIYFCQFYGCSNTSGDIRLTNDAAASVVPDIAVDKSGNGNWAVVWQDSRDGNTEIYLTSKVLLQPGSLSGTVTDGVTTLPVQSATVAAYLNGALQASTATDASGRYSFPALPAGTYSLALSATGYAASTITNVPVLGGLSNTKNGTLDPLHILGTVSANYWPEDPNQEQITNPWRWGLVQLVRDGMPIASDTTDGSGSFDIHFAPQAGDHVIAELRGLYARVTTCDGAGQCNEIERLQADVPAPLVPLAMSWKASQAVNAYVHTVRGLRDFWYARFGIDFNWPIPAGSQRDTPSQVSVLVNTAVDTKLGGCVSFPSL